MLCGTYKKEISKDCVQIIRELHYMAITLSLCRSAPIDLLRVATWTGVCQALTLWVPGAACRMQLKWRARNCSAIPRATLVVRNYVLHGWAWQYAAPA